MTGAAFSDPTASKSLWYWWAAPLAIGALGAAPHLIFSLVVGELAYFKSAYDEDTYFILRNDLGLYRYLSTRLTNLLLAIAGRRPDATMILLDILLPAFAMWGALFFASRISKAASVRILVAILLVFSSDLFSLANATLWRSEILSAARALMGSLGGQVIPDASSTFLNIYRSPEPQLSLGFLFILWALLVDVAKGVPLERTPRAGLFALCLLALPSGYAFIYLPGLASVGVVALIAIWRRRFGSFLFLAATGVLSLAIFAWISLDGGDGGLIFASRLPILTPAVLASLALTPFAAVAAWRSRERDVLFLALAFIAMPAALCNQQLLTGVMVGAKDWERNITYPLLVAGLSLSAPAATQQLAMLRRFTWLPAATATCLAALVVFAQARAYRMWLPLNLRTVAMTRALAAAGEATTPARLVLDDVSLAPLLAVRRAGSTFVLDYTPLFRQRIPSMTADGARPQSLHETNLFEYFWRHGRAPEEVETILATEARGRGGFFLGFLFSFRDYWYPATDNRLVRQADIERLLPSIIADYRRFVATGGRSRVNETVIRLSGLSSLPADGNVENLRIGVGSAGSEIIYAYRQTP